MGVLVWHGWRRYGRIFCSDFDLSVVANVALAGGGRHRSNASCKHTCARFLTKRQISRCADPHWIGFDFGDLHGISGGLHL